MTPYDRAWDMGVYTGYMWVYDGICQVVRIPDAPAASANWGLLRMEILSAKSVIITVT